ncbi:hypothetical protein [Escherichia coli]|uniref:hypothetical protein n=1 Tax=Escherichia coli TaxID=562 RepID=UPI00386032E3
MMRKYFPLEASERLFVAIEEDDVVDAQVSLPPTIALSCTTEIIHDNYALCLQFWLNGVDRQELLRLVRKQAKGDELTADERKQFKYMINDTRTGNQYQRKLDRTTCGIVKA